MTLSVTRWLAPSAVSATPTSAVASGAWTEINDEREEV